MAWKPMVAAGVAVVSAGAIVAAVPAATVPGSDVRVPATAQAPITVTVDRLQLLALSEDTVDALVDVYLNGYNGCPDGPCIGPEDPYYPTEDPVPPAGLTGVAYYLSDEILLPIVEAQVPVVSPSVNFFYQNVSPYLFEVGLLAAIHVAIAESTGGPDGPVNQFITEVLRLVGVIQAPAVPDADDEMTAFVQDTVLGHGSGGGSDGGDSDGPDPSEDTADELRTDADDTEQTEESAQDAEGAEESAPKRSPKRSAGDDSDASDRATDTETDAEDDESPAAEDAEPADDEPTADKAGGAEGAQK